MSTEHGPVRIALWCAAASVALVVCLALLALSIILDHLREWAFAAAEWCDHNNLSLLYWASERLQP